MLVWVDLSFLLMIVFGPICGFIAAQEHKGGTLSSILFALVGVAIGIGVAKVWGKFVCSVWSSKGLRRAVQVFVCILTPFFGLLAIAFALFILARMLYA